jgi:hypothetical protein
VARYAAAPRFHHESTGRAAVPNLGDITVPLSGVRDVNLEVGDGEGKALCPDIWPMREARVILFRVRPEAEPPQHSDELVAKVPMSVVPSARVAQALQTQKGQTRGGERVS